MLTINEALSQIPFHKAEYFRYKFPDVRYDQSRQCLDEEQFLLRVGRSTIYTYHRWEKSAQWRTLVALYLESKMANELLEMYQAVKDNALKGDEKAVKLYLQLGKEIQQMARQTPLLSSRKKKAEDNEDDDDLIIS